MWIAPILPIAPNVQLELELDEDVQAAVPSAEVAGASAEVAEEAVFPKDSLGNQYMESHSHTFPEDPIPIPKLSSGGRRESSPETRF